MWNWTQKILLSTSAFQWQSQLMRFLESRWFSRDSPKLRHSCLSNMKCLRLAFSPPSRRQACESNSLISRLSILQICNMASNSPDFWMLASSFLICLMGTIQWKWTLFAKEKIPFRGHNGGQISQVHGHKANGIDVVGHFRWGTSWRVGEKLVKGKKDRNVHAYQTGDIPKYTPHTWRVCKVMVPLYTGRDSKCKSRVPAHISKECRPRAQTAGGFRGLRVIRCRRKGDLRFSERWVHSQISSSLTL